MEQRQGLLDRWQDLPLAQRDGAPDGVDAPEVAAVLMDGGRLQIRPQPTEEVTDPDAQPEPPRPGVPVPPAAQAGPAEATGGADEAGRPRHWREDKVGVLATLDSKAHPADPCPELPEVFADPLVVLKLAREVGHLDGVPPAGAFRPTTPDEPGPGPAEDGEAPAPVASRGKRPGRPEVVSKRVLASRQDSAHFGPLLAAAAWGLGLCAAARRAFVADGAACNWTVQKAYFPRWTPVLDFIHALSYVFAAALAGRPVREGWGVYQRWITWLWQGRVEDLLGALRARLAEWGGPAEGAAAVATCLGYVEEHRGRMNYAAYRRQGLPIMSSLVESVVKQIGQRVKGTEKFWSEEGAEALLQLRADYLSDDDPLETFWQERADRMTGQRPRHKRVA